MIKIYNVNNRNFVSPYGTAYKLNSFTKADIIYNEIKPLVPNMTSDNTPNGYIITCSYNSYEDQLYGAYFAFDGIPYDNNTWKGWYPKNIPNWIQVQFPKEVKLKSYLLKAPIEDSYICTSWLLQGSTNGTSFDTIDEQSNQNMSINEEKTINIDVNNSYLYLRLTVLTSKGSYVFVPKIQFYGS